MRDDRGSNVRVGSLDARVAARANAYYALARAFDRPSRWPHDLGSLLYKAFAQLGSELSGLARRVADFAKADRALSVTHARLFLGPFEVEAAPWASFYLDPERQLMGPVSHYAAQAYAEAGLAPTDGPTDAPDHVTHELEFMYFLAFQEATEGDPVWRQRQQRFWCEHLSQWLPGFVDATERAAPEETFYACLAGLTRRFIEAESDFFGAQPTAVEHDPLNPRQPG